MAISNDRELGRLTEAVNTLQKAVERLSNDVQELESAMAGIKGGWRSVATISAIIGGLCAVGFIKIAPFIGIFPK